MGGGKSTIMSMPADAMGMSGIPSRSFDICFLPPPLRRTSYATPLTCKPGTFRAARGLGPEPHGGPLCSLPPFPPATSGSVSADLDGAWVGSFLHICICYLKTGGTARGGRGWLSSVVRVMLFMQKVPGLAPSIATPKNLKGYERNPTWAPGGSPPSTTDGLDAPKDPTFRPHATIALPEHTLQGSQLTHLQTKSSGGHVRVNQTLDI